MLTSQEVFVGPYMATSSEPEREKFCQSYLDMTNGFLAIPILFPGTAVWKAKQGRLYIVSVLEKYAARSKTAMKVKTNFSTTSWSMEDGVYLLLQHVH